MAMPEYVVAISGAVVAMIDARCGRAWRVRGE
jgi:hypothetical protein